VEGNTDAISNRDLLESKMTHEQIAKAQQLENEWIKSHPHKRCIQISVDVRVIIISKHVKYFLVSINAKIFHVFGIGGKSHQ
jgi:hypothetical protein